MALPSFSSLTFTAIQAALKAGDILKRGFGTSYEITAKPGKQNFVTKYDKASEDCIISFIQEQFPLHSFLAEESGFTRRSKKDDILWIIDPLDGTTNFAHHIPIFAISIAAYYKKKGICGVIFQPFTQELFIAEKGKGAYLNGSRLKVTQTKQIKDSLIFASLPCEANPTSPLDLKKFIRMAQQGVTLRRLGSTAIALAYVAAGKADAFWGYDVYPWDLAAGHILIEEAGGSVSLYKDIHSTYSPSNILASNQALHSFLQKSLFIAKQHPSI